jgi:hypothetical protein
LSFFKKAQLKFGVPRKKGQDFHLSRPVLGSFQGDKEKASIRLFGIF